MNICTRCQKRKCRGDLCFSCKGILKRNPDAVLRPNAVGAQAMTLEERFWAKVEKTDDCWNWIGYTDKDGYGGFMVEGNPVRAHRYAYELVHGPIPEGMHLDHLCHTVDCKGDCPHRRCVNPDHLAPATPRENTLRGNGLAATNAEKGHCKRGHLLSGDNLLIQRWPDGTIKGRGCRECKKQTDREAYARRKQKEAQ